MDDQYREILTSVIKELNESANLMSPEKASLNRGAARWIERKMQEDKESDRISLEIWRKRALAAQSVVGDLYLKWQEALNKETE